MARQSLSPEIFHAPASFDGAFTYHTPSDAAGYGAVVGAGL